MSSDQLNEEPLDWVSGAVDLNVGGRRLRMELTVPATPVRPQRMLPALQKMTDAFVDIAVQEQGQRGRSVSCRAGCGACCRQLVPISEIEARHLSELVAAMPEPRRTQVRQRFEAARRKLADAGMLESLRDPDKLGEQTVAELGLAYFKLGIACPFLEDESCSIHPERPLACREYLVTNPPENCAHPTAESIDKIEIPAKVSNAVIRLGKQVSARFIPYVAMILALEWAQDHPDWMPRQSGPDFLKRVMENLSGKKIEEHPSAGHPGDQESRR